MALRERILIAGFSGAGKSSFLKELEKIAPEGWTFCDLDQLIYKKHSKGEADLASLIEVAGWEKFRLWERQELEDWLKEEGKGVMALGGGAFTPLIWELYQHARRVQFLHLKASFETCWERLVGSAEVRPLVARGKQELEKLYQERLKVYDQIPWTLENDDGAAVSDLALSFWNS